MWIPILMPSSVRRLLKYRENLLGARLSDSGVQYNQKYVSAVLDVLYEVCQRR